MHEIRTHIHINAPRDVVWAALVDLSRYSDWNPFVTDAKGIIAPGERIWIHVQVPDGPEMDFKPVVYDFKEGVYFRWMGKTLIPGFFTGRHQYELEDAPGGGTTFHHFEHFSGWGVPLLRKNLFPKNRRGYEAMNEALKVLVEAR